MEKKVDGLVRVSPRARITVRKVRSASGRNYWCVGELLDGQWNILRDCNPPVPYAYAAQKNAWNCARHIRKEMKPKKAS